MALCCVHYTHGAGEAYPMFINNNWVEFHFTHCPGEESDRETVWVKESFVSFPAAKDSFPLSFRFSTHRNVPWPNNAAAKFIWESALLSYILDFSPQIYTSQYRGRSWEYLCFSSPTPRRGSTSDIATSRTRYVYFVDAFPLSRLIKGFQVRWEFSYFVRRLLSAYIPHCGSATVAFEQNESEKSTISR